MCLCLQKKVHSYTALITKVIQMETSTNPVRFSFKVNWCTYVTDEGNDRIQVFQQDGSFIRQFGNGIVKSPTGIAATSDGYIVVASHSTHKLSVFTKSGRCVHEVTDIGLKGPRGVTID